MTITATINVGLARNDGNKLDNTLAQVLTVLHQQGLYAQQWRLTYSETELTAVVVIECENATSLIGGLYTACFPLSQDCIATNYGGGWLVGPNATSWGTYDESRFIDF